MFLLLHSILNILTADKHFFKDEIAKFWYQITVLESPESLNYNYLKLAIKVSTVLWSGPYKMQSFPV